MRTIGLLGGMSWVSTTHYYRRLNAGVAERLGGTHCAPLVLWQTDFARITELQEHERWHEAGELLGDGAEALIAAGAELVVICANTMHLVIEQVSAACLDVPVVSIIDAVRDACVEGGVTRLGLIGTAYTMSSPRLFPLPLAEAGIEVLVPDVETQAVIHRFTYDELVHDVVSDDARAAFRDACEALVERGAQAVVLACTEHGMVLHDGDLAVPVLDSTELHIAAILEQCFSE